MLFLFKAAGGLIVTDANTDNSLYESRSLHTTYLKTKRYQNSYVVRVARIWKTLPDELREPDISLQKFKSLLFRLLLLSYHIVIDFRRR